VLVGLALTAHTTERGPRRVRQRDGDQVAPTALGAPTTLTVAHVVKYATPRSCTHPRRRSRSPGAPARTTSPGSRSSGPPTRQRSRRSGRRPPGRRPSHDLNPDGNGVPAGTYYYRVKAFATGLPDSAYSNVDSVRFATPGSPLTIDHSSGCQQRRPRTPEERDRKGVRRPWRPEVACRGSQGRGPLGDRPFKVAKRIQGPYTLKARAGDTR